MRRSFAFSNGLLFLYLLFCLFNSNDGRPSERSKLPADWRKLIGDDVFSRYSNKSRNMGKKAFFEGDIEGVDMEVMDNKNLSASLAQDAVVDANKKWSNGVVPVFIAPNSFTPRELGVIKGALRDIMSKTCVKFVRRCSEEVYLNFVKSESTCSSLIGKSSRKQDIKLQEGCINHYGEIQHEVMHALGFYHEQSRTDRDKHIQINWDNILPEMDDQFEKYRGDRMDLPYDHNSIMHYEWNAFAIDDQLPTIIPIGRKQAELGNRKSLSVLDVKRINILYECDPTKRSRGPPERTTRRRPSHSRPGSEENYGRISPQRCQSTGNDFRLSASSSATLPRPFTRPRGGFGEANNPSRPLQFDSSVEPDSSESLPLDEEDPSSQTPQCPAVRPIRHRADNCQSNQDCRDYGPEALCCSYCEEDECKNYCRQPEMT